ncbi:MAG: tRNA (adenosine(37)-N6)-dimethylallyltransferase MiaA [Fuerstiella sp.]
MPAASNKLKHCWFLAGPTACGKTATSLELAQQLNAEIVSLDSMAVYRGMDIGTAKPAKHEQNRVRHHLIDVVAPHQEFSVADYVTRAVETIDDILNRNRVPLFVGGTGLYLRSLLRGVFEGPAADWTLRQALQKEAEEHGPDWLHTQLGQADPVTADRLHPRDERRIIRALEVFRLTGQPISEQQDHQPLPEAERPAAVFWLEPPRDWLHQRINQRVDQMMQQGLLQETEQLLACQPPPGRTARQALGYRELISHLEDGIPLPVAIEQICIRTRQFAKRQHTWFRNLEECTSIQISGTEQPAELASRLLAKGSSAGHTG